MRAIVTATFPLGEDPKTVREVLTEACRQVRDAYREHFLSDAAGNLIEEPPVYGVTSLDATGRSAQLAVITKNKPGSLWTMEKVLREVIWEKCRERGVELA